MRVLLDFIPLKRGGGVQVGLGLIERLAHCGPEDHSFSAVTTAGTDIDRRLQNIDSIEVVHRVAPHVASRLLFERYHLPALLRRTRPDVIYSQFGTGVPGHGTTVVVGSAYSNLYYPEVDFWASWPLHYRSLFRLRDQFRLKRTLAADGWIFETEVLAVRAMDLYGLPRARVTVVPPSVSPYVYLEAHHTEVCERCARLPGGFRVGILSGWHMNKGLTIVPRVARELRDRFGIHDIRFVMSIDPGHYFSRKLMAEAESLGVSENIVCFGSVPQDGCAEFYRATDVVLLLSLLESFSNNIVEAWTMRKPLVISQGDWSQAICGDSAVYVDREDPEDIACGIATLRGDPALRASLALQGDQLLSTYPSLDEKVARYLSFIDHIAALGPRIRRSSAVPAND